jgi:hypothetical protein
MKQAILREIVPIGLALANLLYLALNLDAYERMVMGGEPNSRLATANTVYLVVVTIWWVAQIVTLLLNDKRRAIHDYIASSVVLRLGVQVAGPGERQEGVAGSWLKGLERLGRPGMAGFGAGAAAITSLVSPTLLLLSSGGEICPGYRTDVAGYYLKLVPLTLVAALVGAVVGAAIGWPRPLFAKGEGFDWRLGCGILAVVVGGVGLALISCILAIYPGC